MLVIEKWYKKLNVEVKIFYEFRIIEACINE